jgi:hypothetical protein
MGSSVIYKKEFFRCAAEAGYCIGEMGGVYLAFPEMVAIEHNIKELEKVIPLVQFVEPVGLIAEDGNANP